MNYYTCAVVYDLLIYVNVPDYGFVVDSCSVVDLRSCMGFLLLSCKLLCLLWICIISFIVIVQIDQRSKTSQCFNR